MKAFKKATALVAISVGAWTLYAADPAMPFPQFRSRPALNHHQTAPAGVQSMYDVVTEQYARYKEHLVPSKTVPGGYYIESKATDGNTNTLTVSEAHGWGMLVMVKMAGHEPKAKEYFEGLYKFYKNFTVDGRSLMHWKIDNGETVRTDWWTGSNGTATDGDLDIAHALLLAHKQWGVKEYKDQALKIIADLKAHSWNIDSKLPLLGPWAKGGSMGQATRPSDWMSGHLRDFAKASNDNWWISAAQEQYNEYDRITKHSANTTRALVPDFIDAGNPAKPGFLETPNDGNFWVNASRVPFRFASDVAVFNDNHARRSLENMVDWMIDKSEGDPGKIEYGYTLSGNVINEGTTSAIFTAPFLAAATINPKYQAFLQRTWNEIQQPWYSENTDAYTDAIKLLSLLVATGNWWGLNCENTWYDIEEVNTSGIVFDHFSNEYGPGNGQNHLGQLNGVLWGDQRYGENGGDTTYYHGGGWWYAFGTSRAEIRAKDGSPIMKRGARGAEGMDAMIPEGKKYLSLTIDIDGEDEDNYDNAGIGAPFVEDITFIEDGKTESKARYVDLRNLESITLRVRGKGNVRMHFKTEDVDNSGIDWGNWGYDFKLSDEDEWQYIEVFTNDIAASPWSPLEELVKDDSDNWGWSESGARAVEALLFNFAQASQTRETEVIFEVDGIWLNGITYSDLGLESRPVSIVNAEYSLGRTGNVARVLVQDGVNLAFEASPGTPVQATMFNVQGRQVASISSVATSGMNNLSLGTNFARGIYLMKVTVGTQQMIQQIQIR